MSREFEAAAVADDRAPGRSRGRPRRDLVDRFIEINRWTISRKTVLLSAVLLPFQILGGVVAHLMLRDTGIVDMRYLDAIACSGAAVFAVCLLASLVAVRRGLNGLWTA